jgi:hypothetical protein
MQYVVRNPYEQPISHCIKTSAILCYVVKKPTIDQFKGIILGLVEAKIVNSQLKNHSPFTDQNGKYVNRSAIKY